MSDWPALSLADQVLINAAGWLCTGTAHELDVEARVLAVVARWLPKATPGHPILEPVLVRLRLLLPDGAGHDQVGAHKGAERAVVVMGLQGHMATLLLWRMDAALERLTGPAPSHPAPGERAACASATP